MSASEVAGEWQAVPDCDHRGMSKKHVRLSRGTAEIHEGELLGPGMTRASDAELRAAMERVDPDRPWSQARTAVRPMLPRVRPYPFAVEPVRTMLRPGILVGFAMDLGPALSIVDQAQLDRWGVTVETVAEQALANVRELAARCNPDRLARQTLAGQPALTLQTGEGVAAAMLLVPETLPRILGPGPLLLLAPMRDLLIGLPATTVQALAAWIAAELESMDPNHLHLGGWLFEAGTVCPVPLEDAFATA